MSLEMTERDDAGGRWTWRSGELTVEALAVADGMVGLWWGVEVLRVWEEAEGEG